MHKQRRDSRAKKYIYGAPTLLEFVSGWVIEYKYLNKETGKLIRHRKKFQRIRKKQEMTSWPANKPEKES